ncbi:MAG: SRPBCC family protein [Bacteroidetes bacterium]|nr:SRPBCC family protein [Bacteroidota bacterium]
MKLKESIIIDRAIEIVWDHVQDPYYMKKWNPRVKNIIPLPETFPGIGYKFKTEYEMMGSPDLFNAEIIEYKKPKSILIRYKNTTGKFPGYILEKFELKETNNGTLLSRYIDFSKSGLNLSLRLLLYLLGILGRPIGNKYLSRLKKLVEC